MLISSLAGHPHTLQEKRGVINFGNVLSAVLLLFGVVGAAAEYRHRTLAPALLIAPNRGSSPSRGCSPTRSPRWPSAC